MSVFLWIVGTVIVVSILWNVTAEVSRLFSPKWACKEMGEHEWTNTFRRAGRFPWPMPTGRQRCCYCRKTRKEPPVIDDGGYEVGQ